jgi:hypothetical protein
MVSYPWLWYHLEIAGKFWAIGTKSGHFGMCSIVLVETLVPVTIQNVYRQPECGGLYL